MNVELVMAVVNKTAQTTLAASRAPVLLATLSMEMAQLVMVGSLLDYYMNNQFILFHSQLHCVAYTNQLSMCFPFEVLPLAGLQHPQWPIQPWAYRFFGEPHLRM